MSLNATVETVTGGTLADNITLTAAASGTVYNLGAGTDRLTLANGANTVTTSEVESIVGGTGADDVTLSTVTTNLVLDLGGGTTDKLTLANGANTVSASNVETIVGNAGADVVTLTSVVSNGNIDLAAGADQLILANGSNNLTCHRRGDAHRRYRSRHYYAGCGPKQWRIQPRGRRRPFDPVWCCGKPLESGRQRGTSHRRCRGRHAHSDPSSFRRGIRPWLRALTPDTGQRHQLAHRLQRGVGHRQCR